ncbi:MAG: hypothetical protein WDW36_004439 [Sanguina aurantia]
MRHQKIGLSLKARRSRGPGDAARNNPSFEGVLAPREQQQTTHSSHTGTPNILTHTHRAGGGRVPTQRWSTTPVPPRSQHLERSSDPSTAATPGALDPSPEHRSAGGPDLRSSVAYYKWGR